MKYLFLLLCCLPMLGFTQPQMNQTPVKWKFELKKKSDKQYTVMATATIESGWHLFTPDPGGDGFLIPTSILLEASEEITSPKKLNVESKIITKDLPEVGVVNYVEGRAVFSIDITTTSPVTTVKGTLTFQCCNDRMCLPPADEVFTFELK